MVDHHVVKARRNIARSSLPEGQIKVLKIDYHHLEGLDEALFDGAYTMETFVHATDPKVVLANFYRVLRPEATYHSSNTTTNYWRRRPTICCNRCA